MPVETVCDRGVVTAVVSPMRPWSVIALSVVLVLFVMGQVTLVLAPALISGGWLIAGGAILVLLVVAVAVGLSLLRWVVGVHVFTRDSNYLYVQERFGTVPVRFSRQYALRSMLRCDVETVTFARKGRQLQRFRVACDYLGRRVNFAENLSDVDANKLFRDVFAEIPRLNTGG